MSERAEDAPNDDARVHEVTTSPTTSTAPAPTTASSTVLVTAGSSPGTIEPLVAPDGSVLPTATTSNSNSSNNNNPIHNSVAPFVRQILDNPDRSTMESVWRLRAQEQHVKQKARTEREANVLPYLTASSSSSSTGGSSRNSRALTIRVEEEVERDRDDLQIVSRLRERQLPGTVVASHREAQEALAQQGLNTILRQLPGANPLTPRTAMVAKAMFGSSINSPLTLSKVAAAMIAKDPTMQQQLRDDAWRVAMSLSGEQPDPLFPRAEAKRIHLTNSNSGGGDDDKRVIIAGLIEASPASRSTAAGRSVSHAEDDVTSTEERPTDSRRITAGSTDREEQEDDDVPRVREMGGQVQSVDDDVPL